ncbi:hypothetical protein [Microbacterium sp. KR10-403]|uniref:hypothetical protein n=1 Tax=Microbacterium sp. KR10-403 TaxID=3158581 RepID=UPI0032E38F3F
MGNRSWKHTDSDFTREELELAIDRRAAWDAQVDQWAQEGESFWSDHKPADVDALRASLNNEEEG